MIDRQNTPRELGYYQAAEWEPHEGTWLQWLHDKIYTGYQMKLERTWLSTTVALSTHETDHIVGEQFPGWEIVGIDVVSLIEDGGAIGCVTQPQPVRRRGKHGEHQNADR